MKSILYIIFIGLFLSACTADKKNENGIQYYPISIQKVITTEIENLNKNKVIAVKQVFMSDNFERKKISLEDVIVDLKSFNEFDINKAAWQDSYHISLSDSVTEFTSKESKLPLKKISVYGDLKSPDLLRIYFSNSNNLYESVKLIVIKPNKYYSIFSIQDVKGMKPDTLFVKTYFDKFN